MICLKKILWLSANITGYEWLKFVISKCFPIDIEIMTLSPKAKTVMYDPVDIGKWYQFAIPVHEIEQINLEETLIQKIKPDIIIVGGWRQLIGRNIREIPPLGVIGFHPTLLPFGRGPSPIINSIMQGVKKSGLTLFYYTDRLDAGKVIGQEHFSLEEDDYAWDVYRQEIVAGKILLDKYLPEIIQGIAPKSVQDESTATYFSKNDPKTFNLISLGIPVELIYRKIRALSKYGKKEKGFLNYKGAAILSGDKRIIIWKANRQKDGKIIVEKLEIEGKETDIKPRRSYEKETPVTLPALTLLNWDTRHFGYPCYVMELNEKRGRAPHNFTHFLTGDIVSFILNNKPGFISTKVDYKARHLIKGLRSIGFKIICTNLLFGLKLDNYTPSDIILDRADQSDIEKVKHLAGSLFWSSRFYQDKNFRVNKVNEMFESWVGNSFKDKSHSIFIYHKDDKIAGFVDCKLIKETKKLKGVIDLVGVVQWAQGQGIGLKLIKGAFDWFKANKVQEVIAEAQEANQVSVAMYRKSGMELKSKITVLHLWI